MYMTQMYAMDFRRITGVRFYSTVVGMLYMSRVGLKVGELFHLKLVAGIAQAVPSETYLNSLGVSNKLIKSSREFVTSAEAAPLLHRQHRQLRHHHGFALGQDPDQDLGGVASLADGDGLDRGSARLMRSSSSLKISESLVEQGLGGPPPHSRSGCW